jgi:3-methylcrotonyl-CoA carboxylase alpha subunit
MQYTYESKGASHSVQLEKQSDGSYLAKIGEAQYKVNASQMPDGAWLVHLDGERFLVHIASAREMRYIHVNGLQYQLEKTTGRKRRAGASGAVGNLKAEMPGQVIELRVALGDTVQAGQVLLVLEAMKMEIRITAPYAGTVARLLTKKGDLVERGQLLVEITAEES